MGHKMISQCDTDGKMMEGSKPSCWLMESDQTGGVPLGVPQAGQVIPPRTPTICHSPPIFILDSLEVLVCYFCPFLFFIFL